MLSRFMTRREQLVLFFVSMAIILGSGVLVWVQSDSDEATPETLVQETTPNSDHAATTPIISQRPPSADPKSICVVSVQGEVVNVGVYTLSSTQRVDDAIKAAGGLLSKGDTGRLNLAAKLVDGTTLYIPTLHIQDGLQSDLDAVPSGLEKNHPSYVLSGGVAGTALAAGQAGTTSGLINLNTASKSQLESLPGIGPVYAQGIIDYRDRSPFQRIDEVQDVHGIGEKRFESMRNLITVQ